MLSSAQREMSTVLAHKRSHEDLLNHNIKIDSNPMYGASKAGINFLLGGVSGIVAKSVIAPVDRQKIIFQTSNQRFGFKPLFVMLKSTVQETGTLSLWRGHSLTLLRTFPYAGIQFMAHDFYKYLLLLTQKKNDELSPIRRFIAGSLAGTTASVSLYPLELLRTRMAVQRGHVTKHNSGIYFNVKLLLKEHGVRGFYLGLFPAVVGMVPYAGTAFGTFESLKIMTLRNRDAKKLEHYERVVYGATAGWLAQTITYPLDVVRRRMQTEGAFITTELVQGLDRVSKQRRKYTSISKTLRIVYNEEGLIRGLFKGVSLNWIKGPIALGISFSTYDYLKSHFANQD